MDRYIVQEVHLACWSDGTYTVEADDYSAPRGEGHASFDRTDMLGIALTRVLRATMPSAEIKVASRPT